MPIGAPMITATAIITVLPKIAFSSPPSAPGGGVICVISRGLSAEKPFTSVVTMIQANQNSPKTVAPVAIANAKPLLIRRHLARPKLPPNACAMSVALATCQPQQHQLRNDQYDEGDDEQQKPQRDQGGQINV